MKASTTISGGGTTVREHDMSTPNSATSIFYTATTYQHSLRLWVDSPRLVPPFRAAVAPKEKIVSPGLDSLDSIDPQEKV
jgi:hypothetical protein